MQILCTNVQDNSCVFVLRAQFNAIKYEIEQLFKYLYVYSLRALLTCSLFGNEFPPT